MVLIRLCNTQKYYCKDPIELTYQWGSIYNACCFIDEESARESINKRLQHNPTQIEFVLSYQLKTEDYDFHIDYLFRNGWEFKVGNENFQVYQRGIILLGIGVNIDKPYRSQVALLRRRIDNPEVNNNTFYTIYKGCYFFWKEQFTHELLMMLMVYLKPRNPDEELLYNTAASFDALPEIKYFDRLLNYGKGNF